MLVKFSGDKNQGEIFTKSLTKSLLREFCSGMKTQFLFLQIERKNESVFSLFRQGFYWTRDRQRLLIFWEHLPLQDFLFSGETEVEHFSSRPLERFNLADKWDSLKFCSGEQTPNFYKVFVLSLSCLGQQLNWWPSIQLLSKPQSWFWPGRQHFCLWADEWSFWCWLTNLLAFHLLWQKEKVGKCSTLPLFPLEKWRRWVREASPAAAWESCWCVRCYLRNWIRRREGEGKSLY